MEREPEGFPGGTEDCVCHPDLQAQSVRAVEFLILDQRHESLRLVCTQTVSAELIDRLSGSDIHPDCPPPLNSEYLLFP
jgi:hypothetical protein